MERENGVGGRTGENQVVWKEPPEGEGDESNEPLALDDDGALGAGGASCPACLVDMIQPESV